MMLPENILNTIQDFYETAPLPVAVCYIRENGIEFCYKNPSFLSLDLDEDEFSGLLRVSDTGMDYTVKDVDRAIRFEIHPLKIHKNTKDIFILWGQDLQTTGGPDHVLTTMSHEIRSPMQTVYGALEVLELEMQSSMTNLLPTIRTAKKSAGNVHEILDDILDLAKIQAGLFNLEDLEIPVRTLVAGIIEALQIRLGGKNISLGSQINDDVPAVIRGDPKRLRQILINLCSNAIKFTDEGRVLIKVSTKDAASGSDTKLQFEVSDTGIGISEQDISCLMTPFVQADNSISREYGGTGLGLSISARLIELMKGKLSIESKIGKGSTFLFTIPVEIVENISGDDSEIIHADIYNTLKGVKILSVEPHENAAREIQNSLEATGAHVLAVSTVKQAKEALSRHPFDIGIFEQGLPDGIGLDLIREMADQYPGMELLMYTAREDTGLFYDLQAIGANYLTKPASREGLRRKIAGLVRLDIQTRPKQDKPVLIVEDTLSVAEILKKQFDMIDITADFAINAKEAIEKMKNKIYSMVITDLHMPEMNGANLAGFIRDPDKNLKTPPDVPVIALSADVNPVHLNDKHFSLFQEYLIKPVSLGQLKRLFIRWEILQQSGPATARGQDTGITSGQTDMTGDDTLSSSLSPLSQNSDLQECLDIKKFEHQTGQSREEAYSLLRHFAETVEMRYEEIRHALSEEDIDKIHKESHSLKGAAVSACAKPLAKYCQDINATSDLQEIKTLLQKISQEANMIRKFVENL